MLFITSSQICNFLLSWAIWGCFTPRIFARVTALGLNTVMAFIYYLHIHIIPVNVQFIKMLIIHLKLVSFQDIYTDFLNDKL